MANQKFVQGAKIVTGPNVLFSYLYAFEPNPTSDRSNYGASLIFDKVKCKKDIATIEAAIEDLKNNKEAQALWGGKLPKKLSVSFRDGDEEKDDEIYQNAMFVGANSSKKLIVIDRKRMQITDPDEVYSGIIGCASINLYAYNHPTGGPGIAIGLSAIQKVKDGERLGGGGVDLEKFAEFEDEEDAY
ncbi:ssDNA-binding protein [Mucilaginibacter sp.]|jgi:hypothetical protein|uniref:ssDNA-binding protein n=1 Tax=Mucilaginibacter sp. TaxID=1882438 RepID=UPI003565B925